MSSFHHAETKSSDRLANSNPSNPNTLSTIATTCAALTLAVLLMETVEVNRVLRTWIQGNAFWAYVLVFMGVLAILLTFGSLLLIRLGKLTRLRLLFVGLASGFIGTLVAIPTSPLLLGRGLSPALGALKHPFYLMAISALALGWLAGIISGLLAYAIFQKRYTLVFRVFIAALLVRLVEIGAHLWLGDAVIR